MIVASLALLGGSFAFGFHRGTINEIKKAETQRVQLQEDLLDLNVDLSAKNAEILRLNKEREGLINELENEAVEAEGSSGPGVGTTGGLQRLERRWGKSITSPK